MKIAITADVHMASNGQHPERDHALENICSQALELGIEHVVLAGDILDKGVSAVSSLEKILGKYSSLTFHMIPGNHDAHLTGEMFTVRNLNLYTTPAIEQFSPDTFPILFLPYTPAVTMGDLIQIHAQSLRAGCWYLISHGDWTGSLTAGNPLEPGIYMPLTRTDINTFQPARILLGHIHQPISSSIVHYPGSPCGLDISETGHRSYILLDTSDNTITRKPVDTDLLFFNETFVITPFEEEESVFLEELWNRIDTWDLTESERERSIIRIRLTGYSRNREKLAGVVQNALEGFHFYKDEGPDLSMLLPATDPELAWIASQVVRKIRELEWVPGPDLPTKEDILLSSLAVIYGD